MKAFKKAIAAIAIVAVTFSGIATAWVMEDSIVSGIHISAISENTKLYLSENGSDFTEDITISKDVSLKASVYTDKMFVNQAGEEVKTNTDYILKLTLFCKADDTCSIKAYFDCSIPCGCYIAYKGTWTKVSDGEVIGTATTTSQVFDVYIYVDGNEAEESADGNISLRLETE